MRPRNAPHRFNAGDAIATLQEAIRNLTDRHTTGAPSVTVELVRNAKWDVQLSVKVTANTETPPAALAKHAKEVLKIATATYDSAARKYGTPAPALVPPKATATGRTAKRD